MDNNNFKNDLFGEINHEKQASKAPRLLDKYTKQRFIPYIKLPIEYTIILSIVIFVLLIVAYAAGVEKGKRSFAAFLEENIKLSSELTDPLQIASVQDETEIKEAIEKQEKETYHLSEIEPLMNQVVRDGSNTDSMEGNIVQSKKNTGEFDLEKAPYTIQLASFKKREYAEDEVSELKDKGFNVRFEKRGYWYQVFAYGYRTIEEARKAHNRLSDDYGDCFIRKIN